MEKLKSKNYIAEINHIMESNFQVHSSLLDKFCKIHSLSLQQTVKKTKTSYDIVRVSSNGTKYSCVCYSGLGDRAYYLSSYESSFELAVENIIDLILQCDRIAWVGKSGSISLIDVSNITTIEELEIYCDLFQDYV